MAGANKGNTFRSIDLSVDAWPQADYAEFVAHLRKAVTGVKNERFDWYTGQHRSANWVNVFRMAMVWLGTLAALATALAAAFRVFAGAKPPDTPWDMVFLVAAVVLYAAMVALAFYERTAEGTGHYFRSMTAILQIRDLWTAYQFKDAQMSLDPPPAAADLVAAKRRWLDAAQAFVTALDVIATQELSEWRGAFQAAIGQLSSAAAAGLTASQTALADAVKADAAVAAKAAEEAKKAAEAAKQEARPAILNLAIDDASVGEATVKIDGRIVAQGPGRSFAIANLPQGVHIVRAEIAAVGAAAAKAAEEAKDFPAGITPLRLKPT
jgi:hypothetical protein